MEDTRQPSPPKAQRIPTMSEEDVDQELEDLFTGPARSAEPIPDEYEKFIASTARSKIAVIVPMYGYWADVWATADSEKIEKQNKAKLDEQAMKLALNRVVSYTHTWYTILVSEPERLSPKVIEVLNGPYVGGNLRGIRVPVGSTWSEYVAKGMEVALEETKAQYIVVFNPWGMIQKHGLDSMIERVNLNGASPIVCGYDMHRELSFEHFEAHKPSAPREYASYKAKHMLSFDFIGMKRMVAEMCVIDPRFKTQAFAERDFFQQAAMKGLDAVASERVPTFFFDVFWDGLIPESFYQDDLEQFRKKWGFSPADIKVK